MTLCSIFHTYKTSKGPYSNHYKSHTSPLNPPHRMTTEADEWNDSRCKEKHLLWKQHWRKTILTKTCHEIHGGWIARIKLKGNVLSFSSTRELWRIISNSSGITRNIPGIMEMRAISVVEMSFARKCKEGVKAVSQIKAKIIDCFD